MQTYFSDALNVGLNYDRTKRLNIDDHSIKNASPLNRFSYSQLQEQNYTVRIIEYRRLTELAEHAAAMTAIINRAVTE